MGEFSSVSTSPAYTAYSCQSPVSDISLAYFRLEMSPFCDNISLLSVLLKMIENFAKKNRPAREML